MRITINQYRLNGYRLKIESHSDTGIDTSVDIDMSKLSFFKGKIPSHLLDLFYLSSVVYGIDRSISRHACSIDGWSREFHVIMRLPNSKLFMRNKDKVDNAILAKEYDGIAGQDPSVVKIREKLCIDVI